MLINKSILAVFLALASQQQYASAFTPPSLPAGRTISSNVVGISSSMVATPTAAQATADDTDVSIPYDAAARLAYDAWCEKYNKTPNEDKFDTFKANYETITVANVVAAKEAQDNGTDRSKDLELNEYGDFTEAEYMAMQSGGSGAEEEESEAAPTVTELKAQGEEEEEKKGALETVMEASAAQSEASSALSEAADALAEEEEVRFQSCFLMHKKKILTHVSYIHIIYIETCQTTWNGKYRRT